MRFGDCRPIASNRRRAAMGEPSRKCCLLFVALAMMTAGAMLSVCAWFSPPLTVGILRVRQAGPIVLLLGAVLLFATCCTPACAHRKWTFPCRRCLGDVDGSVVSRSSSVSTECSVRRGVQGETRWLNAVSSSESGESEIELAAYGEEDFATSCVHHHRHGRISHGRARSCYSRIPAMTPDMRCSCNASVDEVRSVTSTEADTLSSGCGPGPGIDRQPTYSPLQASNSGCTSGHCTASNEDNAHEDDICAETLVSIRRHPDFFSTLGLTTFDRNAHACHVTVSKGARVSGSHPVSQRNLNEYTKEFQAFPPNNVYRYRDPNKCSPQWRPLVRRSRSADSSDCWPTSLAVGSRDVPSVVIDRPEAKQCVCVQRSLPPGYSEA